MLESEILILPHIIFLGLIPLEEVGFQTIYNYFNDSKSLSSLMMVDNLKDLTNLLGRTLTTNNANFSHFLEGKIKKGEGFFQELTKGFSH